MGAGVSFAELSAFMNERDDRAEAKAEKARKEAKAEKAELKAEMAELNAEMEKARREAEAEKAELKAEMERQLRDAKPQSASEAISEEKLDALQARLQRLHAEAQLLTEEELGNLEDTIADCIEVLGTGDVRDHAVDQTLRMVALSEKMKVDGSFARQVRRKFTQLS